jgi:hypothetical protein
MGVRYTADEIARRFCVSRAMPVSPVFGAATRQDLQIAELLQQVGDELAADSYMWKFLEREFTVTTVVGQATYDLPEDFNGFISDSSWNRTTRLPVIGGLEEFEWQMLKARLVAGTTFTALYRITSQPVPTATQGQIEFYDTPQSAQTIVLPYRSTYWVYSSASVAPGLSSVIGATVQDTPLFDGGLMVAGLNLAWCVAKGLDDKVARARYERVLAAAKSNDVSGRTLSLAGGGDYPYLGVLNLPDTSYGS